MAKTGENDNISILPVKKHDKPPLLGEKLDGY